MASTAPTRTAGKAAHRPGWEMPLRITLALFGTYGLTSTSTALLARLLPGSALDASVVASMLSFAIATAIVVWIFAARSALAVSGWVLGLMVGTGGLFWLLAPADIRAGLLG